MQHFVSNAQTKTPITSAQKRLRCKPTMTQMCPNNVTGAAEQRGGGTGARCRKTVYVYQKLQIGRDCQFLNCTECSVGFAINV